MAGALQEVYSGGTNIIGDGSTTEFEFDFEYVNENDIFYQIGDNDPVRFTSNLGIVNNNTVIFDTAPANGEEGKIIRQSNLIRQTDPLVGFSYDNLNVEFNNVYAIMQELKVNAQGYGEQLTNEIQDLRTSTGDLYNKGDVAFFNENNINEEWLPADGRLISALDYDLSDKGYNIINTGEEVYTFLSDDIVNGANQFMHSMNYFDGEYYFQEYKSTNQRGIVISKSTEIGGSLTIVNNDLNLGDIDIDSVIKFVQTDKNSGWAIINNSTTETIDLYRIINIGSGSKEFVKSYNYNITIEDRAHLTKDENDPTKCYFLFYEANGIFVDEVIYNDLLQTYSTNSFFTGTSNGIYFFTTTCSANMQVFKNSSDFYFKVPFQKKIFKSNISTGLTTEVYDYNNIDSNFETFNKVELNGHNYITDTNKVFLLGYEYIFGSTRIDILKLDANDNPERIQVDLPRVEFGSGSYNYPPGTDLPYYLKKINNVYIKNDMVLVSQGRTVHKTNDFFSTIDSNIYYPDVDQSGNLNFFFGYFIDFENDNTDNVYNVLTLRQTTQFADHIFTFNYQPAPDGDKFYQLPNYTTWNRGNTKAYIKVK